MFENKGLYAEVPLVGPAPFSFKFRNDWGQEWPPSPDKVLTEEPSDGLGWGPVQSEARRQEAHARLYDAHKVHGGRALSSDEVYDAILAGPPYPKLETDFNWWGSSVCTMPSRKPSGYEPLSNTGGLTFLVPSKYADARREAEFKQSRLNEPWGEERSNGMRSRERRREFDVEPGTSVSGRDSLRD